MFFRIKQSGPRSYLQIVETQRDGGAVRQHVIATLGRADELAARGALAALLASGARHCEQVMLLSTLQADLDRPHVLARRIGAPLLFGRLCCGSRPAAAPCSRTCLRPAVGADRLPRRARGPAQSA